MVQTDRWSSGLAFIIASIGSAVGLGNFWRFPYMVGINGGGTFIIAYLLCVLLVGIPLMLVEITIGKHYKESLAGTFKKLKKEYVFLTFIPFLIMLFTVSFYVVISGWTLSYAYNSFTGNFITFDDYSRTYDGVYPYLIVLLITIITIFLGVKRGIENVSKVLVPLLFFIAILIVFFVLSLPNSSKGLEFYLTVYPYRLTDVSLWLYALGQAVFSLSVGYGLMLTYAAYTDNRGSVLNDSIKIAFADTLIAFLAGLFIFPAVFAFDQNPAGGTTLAFTTLPHVFEKMHLGTFVGTAFFILLFIAALTSCIAFVEFLVSNLCTYLSIGRKEATLGVGILVGILAIPSAFSYTPSLVKLGDKPFIDAIDLYFVSVAAPLSILIICLLLWFMDREDFVKELDGNSNKIGTYIYSWCKYVLPIVGIILFLFAVENILFV